MALAEGQGLFAISPLEPYTNIGKHFDSRKKTTSALTTLHNPEQLF